MELPSRRECPGIVLFVSFTFFFDMFYSVILFQRHGFISMLHGGQNYFQKIVPSDF